MYFKIFVYVFRDFYMEKQSLLLFTCGRMYVCFDFIQISNKNSKNQLRTLTNILCDQVCKNRSYLHKIHLFILSYLSLFLCVSFIEFLRKCCSYYEILIKYYVRKKGY